MAVTLPPVELLRPLSKRQLEVMELAALGYTANEIAERLDLAYDTVRSHMNKALGNLNARNSVAACVFLVREGIL